MSLQHVALGRALGDAHHAVHEEGGNNAGMWIRRYLLNTDPPINNAAPWCAAAVQYWADMAAKLLGLPNPLDAVKLEAFVPSYHDWGVLENKLVAYNAAVAGDLVCYNFGGQRWDHIGMLARRVTGTTFISIEGNTSAGVGETDAERQREGDGVYMKTRTLTRQPVAFIRWGA